MKTAMEELKSIIESMINNGGDSDLLAVVSHIDNWGIKKEKEQIIDAHIEGQRVFDKYQHTQWTNDQAEHYYNQAYKQEIEKL